MHNGLTLVAGMPTDHLEEWIAYYLQLAMVETFLEEVEYSGWCATLTQIIIQKQPQLI